MSLDVRPVRPDLLRDARGKLGLLERVPAGCTGLVQGLADRGFDAHHSIPHLKTASYTYTFSIESDQDTALDGVLWMCPREALFGSPVDGCQLDPDSDSPEARSIQAAAKGPHLRHSQIGIRELFK